MTLDGITLKAIVEELKTIENARIEKIYQPFKDEITLLLHTGDGKKRLYMSASGSDPRLHITDAQPKNPDKAPNFCMLLRKYITGGRIIKTEQVGLERVVKMTVSAKDEIGVVSEFCLVCEIMGKYSNIMLTKDGKVIDSIHRVPPDMSSVRCVLPGLPYELPPMDKLDPLTEDASVLAARLAGGRICASVQGISAQAEREILFRAFGTDSRDMLTDADALKLAQTVKEFVWAMLYDKKPVMQSKDGVPFFYSPAPYLTMPAEGRTYYETVNGVVDAYYSTVAYAKQLESRRGVLKKQLKKYAVRIGKKLATQNEALAGREKAEKLRTCGELLSANIYSIKRGSASAEVYNYYTDANESIPLDPALSPSANVDAYFKKASKLKTAAALADKRVSELTAESEYIETLEYDLDSAVTLEDAEEVRLDMLKYGYIAEEQSKKKKTVRTDPLEKPVFFTTSDGFKVFAGRNNRQNDALTMHAARPEDIWLHAKGVPGSHVILVTDGREPTETAIEEAARAAAEHSGAKGAKTQVDYTQVKNVWKANGARPGMVLYKAQKTIVVSDKN